MLDVISQRLADVMRQWQDPLSARLPASHTQQSEPPVYVVYLQRHDLGSPEPKSRQQKENREVATWGFASGLNAIQELRELVRRKMRWKTCMLRQSGSGNGTVEPRWNNAAPSQEAQKGPDGTPRCPSTVALLRSRVLPNELGHPLNR
jgi:hypothetical protein